jgi:amino-acid N-acetyltransferase
VHAHRGRTFVIAFGGEAVADADFRNLVHDLAMLHGLGIRLVLVHGAGPRSRSAWGGARPLRYVNGLRVTDDAALACVKEAAGAVRVEIEALFSLGLANSPMAGVRIPVASGNFVTAKPLGVLDGVDYLHTGVVRRVDRQSLVQRLDDGAIALMPPIGYSPTGEVFNLSHADVARSAAIALKADKLIFLLEEPGVEDEAGVVVSNVLSGEVQELLTARPELPEDLAQALRAGADACIQGVRRVHLISRRLDGALLRELFTRDGTGTLITDEPFEELRPARIEDVAASSPCCGPWRRRGPGAPLPRAPGDRDRPLLPHRAGRHGRRLRRPLPLPRRRHGRARLRGRAPRVPQPGPRRQAPGPDGGHRPHPGPLRLFVLTTQTAHWFQRARL